MTKPLSPEAPAVSRADYGATLSLDERHRYSLFRRLTDAAPAKARRLVFAMLNPSTADAVVDDPTIRRCMGFGRSWGFDRLDVVNLFSLRSTEPKALYGDASADGDPANIEAIADYARRAELTVCAWGAHGKLRDRSAFVVCRLVNAGVSIHHLGLTKAGQPRHPLYLPGDLQPTPWVRQ